MKNDSIWFHADDFGVTLGQSERILECYTQGALNSISILPNTTSVSECLKLLDKTDTQCEIRRVLHLNFVEGKPLIKKEHIDLLTNQEGFFDKSFIKILFWSITKHGAKRNELKHQLKLEIKAQLDMLTKVNDYRISAIDSHQHYHMIPIVFDTLMEILTENAQEYTAIREIRIPVDSLQPIFKVRGMWRKVPLINYVKWLILKCFEHRNRKKLQKAGIGSPLFFGIFFTCEMKWEIVSKLLPQYIKLAQKHNQKLELMFHPGNLESTKELLDSNSKELEMFYQSENRFKEAECLKRL